MFKNLLVTLSLLVSGFAFAHEGIEARGAIFFKSAEGKLEFKKAALSVPVTKGKKEVTITVNGKTAKSIGVVEKDEEGRKRAMIVFVNPPGTNEHTVAVFMGTLLTANNSSLYFGDIYVTQYKGGDEEKGALDILSEKVTEKGKWVGGFGFHTVKHHHGQAQCTSGKCGTEKCEPAKCGGKCGGSCEGKQQHHGKRHHHGYQGHQGHQGYGHQGHHQHEVSKDVDSEEEFDGDLE